MPRLSVASHGNVAWILMPLIIYMHMITAVVFSLSKCVLFLLLMQKPIGVIFSKS